MKSAFTCSSAFCALLSSLLFALTLPFNAVHAAPANEHAVLAPECKVALRLVTSPDYVSDHQGEIPDADKMDESSKGLFIGNVFRQSMARADSEEQFCGNTIRENLRYRTVIPFPPPCVEFIPLLKKSFDDKVAFTNEGASSVQNKMNDSLAEMLVLAETAPAQLVTRCEVGIKVMHVDLNDRHLKEKYPLPVTCEAFFNEIEKTLILPAQLETLKRQRVLLSIENKNTPKKMDEICEEMTR